MTAQMEAIAGTDHPQVLLDRIEVDEGIAPLLRCLWDQGWRTQFSCQGGPSGDTYILFTDVDHAWQFTIETTTILLGQGIDPDELRPTLDIFAPYRDTGMRGRVSFDQCHLPQVTAAWEDRRPTERDLIGDMAKNLTDQPDMQRNGPILDTSERRIIGEQRRMT